MAEVRLINALLCGALLLLPACSEEIAQNTSANPPSSVSQNTDRADPTSTLKTVQTILAASPEIPDVIEAPSALIVENDVEVMSRVTGIIEEIFVDRGHRVSKGDVLARLENRDLALMAESEEKSFQLARIEFERAKALFETNVISPQDYDTRRLEAEQAEADWKLARVEYDKSFIRAPFDGVVSERYVRLGQRVVEADSTPLFRITAPEPLLARFYLPEARLGHIRVGDRVTIRLRSEPAREYGGRVRWISPVVDAASGTFQAIAEVSRDESDSLLRPGLAVTVHVGLVSGPSPVRIERGALAERGIFSEGANASLFVVLDGRAVLRSVRIGRSHGEEVEILSGLREGEMVIRPFRDDLTDGDRVRIPRTQGRPPGSQDDRP